MADPFEKIIGQPRVRDFLRNSSARDGLAQAYLFVGIPGSNKTTAAYALAQAALCPSKGCESCETCAAINRRKHPDVREYFPEGATGYVLAQIRAIIADVSLAPIKSKKKVYIIHQADQLGTGSANALLKTLEEPPEDAIIILFARSVDSVLPTIVSRCQVIPFATIAPEQAAGIVAQHTGSSVAQAKIAIAVSEGSIESAIAFQKSPLQKDFRRQVVGYLKALPTMNDWEMCRAAKDIVALCNATLDEVKAAQERDAQLSADFLSKGMQKELETQNKRALSAKSLEALHRVCVICRSMVRDCMVVQAGLDDELVNTDVAETIRNVAATVAPQSLVCAYDAVCTCDERFRYNVSPESCIDTLLFDLRSILFG